MPRSLPSFAVATAAFLTLGVVAPVQAQEFMAANAGANTVPFPVTPLAPAPVARAADEGATAAKAEGEQGPTFVRAGYTPRAPSVRWHCRRFMPRRPRCRHSTRTRPTRRLVAAASKPTR